MNKLLSAMQSCGFDIVLLISSRLFKHLTVWPNRRSTFLQSTHQLVSWPGLFFSASPFHCCFGRTFRVPPLLPLLYFHGCTTEFLTYQSQQTASSDHTSDLKTETGAAERKREVETRTSTTKVQSIFGFCCFLCFHLFNHQR